MDIRSPVMRIPPWALALGLILLFTTARPPAARAFRWGAELRAYPAGLLPSFRADLRLNEHDALVLIGGGNFTDRHDWGEHRNEQGNGGGFGVGWLHRLEATERGWFVGARADLWFLSIDWEDPGRSGTTEVTVLQPTATGGYGWNPGEGRLRLEGSASLGAEINISTDGEDVGHGVIVLLGFSALW